MHLEQIHSRLHPFLEALETYQFLTIEQLITLGVPTGQKYSSKRNDATRRLLEARKTAKPLVGAIEGGFIAGKGKLPKLFYLKPAGVQYLAEARQCRVEDIRAPKNRNPIIGQDLLHRIATIDMHIALRQTFAAWGSEDEGFIIDFFATYFEGTGANRTSEETGEPFTRLSKVQITSKPSDYFFPDALLGVRTPQRQTPYLFALEVYRGKDTKRVVKQIENHIRAIENGSIALQMGLEQDHRVLLVFETDAAMEAVMKRLERENVLYGVEQYFYFNTIDKASQRFSRMWSRVRTDKKFRIMSPEVQS